MSTRGSDTASQAIEHVDPRAPRFGQLNTATLLIIGILIQAPSVVALVAVILGTAVLSNWRIDLYTVLWRRIIVHIVGRTAESEPAAPHRFAKLLGAGFTTMATILLLAGIYTGAPTLFLLGYGAAGIVAVLAAVSGIGDYCVGCKLYEQVAFFHRLKIV